ACVARPLCLADSATSAVISRPSSAANPSACPWIASNSCAKSRWSDFAASFRVRYAHDFRYNSHNMCGIAGIYNFGTNQPVDPVVLRRMCTSMAHRGPDGDGLHMDDANGLGLGHRRLSIIDLSLGAQPMATADEKLWITFNGEIYNFKELKQELVA